MVARADDPAGIIDGLESPEARAALILHFYGRPLPEALEPLGDPARSPVRWSDCYVFSRGAGRRRRRRRRSRARGAGGVLCAALQMLHGLTFLHAQDLCCPRGYFAALRSEGGLANVSARGGSVSLAPASVRGASPSRVAADIRGCAEALRALFPSQAKDPFVAAMAHGTYATCRECFQYLHYEPP